MVLHSNWEVANVTNYDEQKSKWRLIQSHRLLFLGLRGGCHLAFPVFSLQSLALWPASSLTPIYLFILCACVPEYTYMDCVHSGCEELGMGAGN